MSHDSSWDARPWTRGDRIESINQSRRDISRARRLATSRSVRLFFSRARVYVSTRARSRASDGTDDSIVVSIEGSTLVRRGILGAQGVQWIARANSRAAVGAREILFARRGVFEGESRAGKVRLDGFPIVVRFRGAHPALGVAAEGVPGGGARANGSRRGARGRTVRERGRGREGEGHVERRGVWMDLSSVTTPRRVVGRRHASSRRPTRSTPVQRLDAGTSRTVNTVSAQPSMPGCSG